MQTKVSTKGQVVLPAPFRRRLGIRAGDPLNVAIRAGCIVLAPRIKRPRKARIVSDPITGFPVLSAGADAPVLSTRQVEEILAEFP